MDLPLVYLQISKALLVSFEAEFASYKTEIIQLSQAVRDEVLLASKRAQKDENELQAKERSKNNKTREIVSKLKGMKEETIKSRLEIHRWRSEGFKTRFLNILSTYDYQKTFKLIRRQCTPGTSQWISKTVEFQTWISGDQKTLWLTGKCRYCMFDLGNGLGNTENSGIWQIGHKVKLFERMNNDVRLIWI